MNADKAGRNQFAENRRQLKVCKVYKVRDF